MSSFIWLVRREWLEHGRAFVWGLGVVLLLVVLAGLVIVPSATEIHIQMSSSGEAGSGMPQGLNLSNRDGENPSAGNLLAALFLDVAGSTDAEIASKISVLTRALAIPFFWLMVFISLFALTAALYDERRDRSVLFFKSMPVGDIATVAAKLGFVTWCVPLVALAFISLAQLYSVALLGLFVEDGMAGRVWGNAGLVSGVFAMLIGLLLQGVVLLPVYSWLLLLSAWARSAPLMWAIAIPFVLVIVEGIVFESGVFADTIDFYFTRHALPQVGLDGMRLLALESGIAEQFAVLAEPRLWLGLVFAGLCFAGACIGRQRNNAV